MTLHVADRGTAVHQISEAAKALGRSPQRIAVFREIQPPTDAAAPRVVRSKAAPAPRRRPTRQAPRTKKRHDIFFSHASEDKDAIARPLYRALKRKRGSVWFDEGTLRIGDSLRSKIDEPLVRSIKEVLDS
jgi:hypothetical protein